jgi:ribosomal protein S18 acetylase RimI-like enzyme
MEKPTLRRLANGELADAARLLGLLSPETPIGLIRERLSTLLQEHPHYEIVGAFSGEKLLGLAGAWTATKIWCGRYLEIDNLIVAPEVRSMGIGTLLMLHLEKLARERDCKILVLDSYASNHSSHRLYHRLGFEIWSFHFIKPIGDWKGDKPS